MVMSRETREAMSDEESACRRAIRDAAAAEQRAQVAIRGPRGRADVARDPLERGQRKSARSVVHNPALEAPDRGASGVPENDEMQTEGELIWSSTQSRRFRPTGRVRRQIRRFRLSGN